eukprot:gene14108-13901_t
MKLKNTLGLAIGSLIAATSIGALAQGQGAVEIEGFAKKEYYDSDRNFKNDGNLFGGSVGYFLTDDVELRLAYDEVHNVRSDSGQNIKGADTALDALYHFNNPGDMLRPYVSAGFSDQSIDQNGSNGRNRSTFANVGGGAKLYFTDNFYARAGVEAQYNIDQGNTEWAPSVGIGVNFELDVKFDFDKSVVKPNSYGDIKNLADFMKQYPSTSTTVEGHTDSVGPDAYNQK